MRYLRGILVAGVAWFAAGCMQFEYGITLEEDLSGTADVDLAIDLDRVAYMSAYIQNAFAGEGGEPTDEQIQELSLIHISEPTRLGMLSRMPSSA